MHAWPFFLFFPFLLLGIAALILWIWALVDAVKVPDDSMFRAATS